MTQLPPFVSKLSCLLELAIPTEGRSDWVKGLEVFAEISTLLNTTVPFYSGGFGAC